MMCLGRCQRADLGDWPLCVLLWTCEWWVIVLSVRLPSPRAVTKTKWRLVAWPVHTINTTDLGLGLDHFFETDRRLYGRHRHPWFIVLCNPRLFNQNACQVLFTSTAPANLISTYMVTVRVRIRLSTRWSGSKIVTGAVCSSFRAERRKVGTDAFQWLEKLRECCPVHYAMSDESPRRTLREILPTWLSRVASIWPDRATLFKDARVGGRPIRHRHRGCSGGGGGGQRSRVDGRYVGFTLMWERSICGFRVREAWGAQRAGFVRGTKGAITSKIKHAIKLKTSPAWLTHPLHNCCSPH